MSVEDFRLPFGEELELRGEAGSCAEQKMTRNMVTTWGVCPLGVCVCVHMCLTLSLYSGTGAVCRHAIDVTKKPHV